MSRLKTSVMGKGTVWTDLMKRTVSVGERDCMDGSDEDESNCKSG